MAGFWGKRARDRQRAKEADESLAQHARSALVAADERIRLTEDEVVFATVELGEDATTDLRTAIDAVRTHMGEAFHLQQLNHDEIPDTPEEVRTRNARIVQLCEWAEDLLDARTEALAEPIARARRAPEIIVQIGRDAHTLRERIPAARETATRLAARYSAHALAAVAANPAEAEQLLGFAEHSATVASRRREDGQREQSNMALEAATEAVRRARTLIEAVDTFEVEALRAESTLAAVVEDSRNDLADARSAPRGAAVADAMTLLEGALAALPAAGVHTDPFADLSRLRQANAALETAVTAAYERAARPIPDLAHVRHAVDDADRQLAVARDVIAGHRGWIGADARTRLAEAERVRSDLDHYLGSSAATVVQIDEDHREQALALARRAAFLASDALTLAQRDIDSARPQQAVTGGDGGMFGGRGAHSDLMGGLLGGFIVGSLLDNLFD